MRSDNVSEAGGSSPLTRGTQSQSQEGVYSPRFIPAYAGNSRKSPFTVPPYPVHPRLRGELYRLSKKRFSRHGSSPLTRGTRCDRHQRFNVCRFIPAYAGNSLDRGASINGDAVHPRLRGELIGLARRLRRRTGSSPLTRGPPDLIQHYEDHQRFIPAYAGNSLWRYKELTL